MGTGLGLSKHMRIRRNGNRFQRRTHHTLKKTKPTYSGFSSQSVQSTLTTVPQIQQTQSPEHRGSRNKDAQQMQSHPNCVLWK